jgi:molecular chaperone HscC
VCCEKIRGGTLDVSIISFANNKKRVLAVAGDNFLGGEDITNAIVEWIVKDIQSRSFWGNLNVTPKDRVRIRNRAEKMKKKFGNSATALFEMNIDNERIKILMERSIFESLIEPLLNKVPSILNHALDDAKLTKGDVDMALLVGGSTRLVKVKTIARDMFGDKVKFSENPDEAVAKGAAIHAFTLQNKAFLAKENRRQETKAHPLSTLSLFLEDPVDRINPHSLGTNTNNCTKEARAACYTNAQLERCWFINELIPKGAILPVKKSKPFTTLADNQEAVTFFVHEDENRYKDPSKSISLVLPEESRGKAGVPSVALDFEMSTSGILTVQAKDEKSGTSVRAVLGVHGVPTETELSKIRTAWIPTCKGVDTEKHQGTPMSKWLAESKLEEHADRFSQFEIDIPMLLGMSRADYRERLGIRDKDVADNLFAVAKEKQRSVCFRK